MARISQFLKTLQGFLHTVSNIIDGRSILVVWVPGGQTRPYKARVSLGKENKEYAYFIRKGSSTVRTRGNDEIELLSLAATVPFDDRFNQQSRVEDLSIDLIRDFLKEVGSELAIFFSGSPHGSSPVFGCFDQPALPSI